LPLYEYQCLQCETRYEKIQKFSDPPLTNCEKCGGELKRLLSPPAIQFKGTGWYVSDYGKKSSASDSSTADSSSTSKPSSATESKGKAAATKADPKPAGAADK